VIAPARRAAFDALLAVARQRRDLPDAIADARERLADDRDRALLVELATGALRMQAALDHVLAAVATRPLARLDLEVLVSLRLGVYQLLYLDRVPASAVVDDAVSLVRASRKTSAAGFVNAALRTVSRTRQAVSLPSRPASAEATRSEQLDYLSIALSHPRWLAARWLDRSGFDSACAWLEFDNRPAPLTLRASTLRITREALAVRLAEDGVRTAPTRYAPDGLVVESGNPLRLAWADEGLFVAQDEGSQLVALLAGARPGERVLDACAAPGGKTLALAAAVGDTGRVVAADVRGRRVAMLASVIARAQAARVEIVRSDAAAGLPFGAVFDAVLVDAPCSGLGVLRREADIRWRRAEGDLAGFAEVQRGILGHAARAVRPGGRLVYATCSPEPEENDHVVESVLTSVPPLGSVPSSGSVPGAGTEVAWFERATTDLVRSWLPEAVRPLVGPDGVFRTLPWRDGLEGFCAFVLVRTR
jgi:16S rRNA (cytosine967-C5)-methyltransferase